MTEKDIRDNTLKFILNVGGGLGDVVTLTLLNNRMSKIKQLVNKHLDRYFKLLIVCHNPNAKDLFYGQDWIDEVKQVEYQHTLDPYIGEMIGFVDISNDNFIQDIFEVADPFELVLTKEEQQVVDDLTKEPFIIVHPFAGENDRMFTSRIIKDIDREHQDINIYVTGANYSRNDKYAEVNPFKENNRVTDLIDKLNVRQTVKLIQHDMCKKVIASHSCIILIAWIYNKENICYFPPNTRAAQQLFAPQLNMWNFGVHRANTKVLPIINGEEVHHD